LAAQVRVGGAINTVAIVALPLIAELPSEAWLQPLLVLQLLLWALGQFTVSHPLPPSEARGLTRASGAAAGYSAGQRHHHEQDPGSDPVQCLGVHVHDGAGPCSLAAILRDSGPPCPNRGPGHFETANGGLRGWLRAARVWQVMMPAG